MWCPPQGSPAFASGPGCCSLIPASHTYLTTQEPQAPCAPSIFPQMKLWRPVSTSACFRPLRIWSRDEQASQGTLQHALQLAFHHIYRVSIRMFYYHATSSIHFHPYSDEQQRGQEGSSVPCQFGASFPTIHFLARACKAERTGSQRIRAQATWTLGASGWKGPASPAGTLHPDQGACSSRISSTNRFP